MAPVGCAVAPPISGLLSIESIPVEGLVDTGASITCLGFAIWWRYCAQWGALKPFTNAVHGAHGKPLQIAGAQSAHVQPTAPSHSAHPHTASCARLLQTADIPPETARLVRCHNPWPSEDVLFCPDGALPAFVIGIPALSSGPELWYAVHNHRPEPLQLHAGQSIGVLEVVHLAEASASAPPSSPHPPSPCQPALPENLSPLQQQQLNELFKEFQDVFSQGDNDLGNTPLLQRDRDQWPPSPPTLPAAEPGSS